MDISTVIAMFVAFFLLACYPGNARVRSAFHRKLRDTWRHAHELKMTEENNGETAHPVT